MLISTYHYCLFMVGEAKLTESEFIIFVFLEEKVHVGFKSNLFSSQVVLIFFH